ncbi:MAG: polysaccharide biosynthesis/export family protein [Thermodesulfobacteriota bacterium]|nr:polysaccharide biosynthesis/export family protein [Thermodesulfobacteriota bacterium]
MRYNILFLSVFLIIVNSVFFVACGNAPIKTPKAVALGESDYVLGPEDVIEVSVWKEEDLSKELIIKPDGKISFPLIGDIQASGLTTEELRENITQALADFIEGVTVSVTVKQINSLKIFIQGEVAAPGVYALKSNFTVLQAISLAGGFTTWAKEDRIVIYRKKEGAVVGIPVNYEKIISGEDPGQNILLLRGDTIVIP